jgi:hypothetical protein
LERRHGVLVRGVGLGLAAVGLVALVGFGLMRNVTVSGDVGVDPAASVEAAEVRAPAGEAWVGPAAESSEPMMNRVPKPSAVRGIYVGSWSVGNESRLESLIRLASETEVNAFVIDIKEARGEVSHGTRVALAREVGADRDLAIEDLRGVLGRLREEGIYPIARIVVFKDPLLAQARPQWSIVRADGELWADNRGVHWVDPFNQDVWDYNIALAREAVELGFSEIQWDYVRFPDVPGSYLRDAVFPARGDRTMVQGIRDFLVYSRAQLARPDIPQTADVFGVTTTARHDVGIGQIWEEMADVTDVLLPMVYPSHYPPARGTWSFPTPSRIVWCAAPWTAPWRARRRSRARRRCGPGSRRSPWATRRTAPRRSGPRSRRSTTRG